MSGLFITHTCGASHVQSPIFTIFLTCSHAKPSLQTANCCERILGFCLSFPFYGVGQNAVFAKILLDQFAVAALNLSSSRGGNTAPHLFVGSGKRDLTSSP